MDDLHIFDRFEFQNPPYASVWKDLDNPLDCLQEEDFRKRYRMSKRSFMKLLSIVIPEDHEYRGGKIPRHLELLVALRFYATGSFQ